MMIRLHTLLLIGLTLVVAGCHEGEETKPTPTIDWQLSSSLDQFTEEEFLEYVAAVQAYEGDVTKEEESSFFESLTTGLSVDVEAPEPTAEEAGAVDEDSITNVQEQGVDEGDIVKAHGDYFIVLSRGRLFSIQVADNGAPLLKPVFKGNAYAEGFTNGTWYDEMLVYDDTIVVIGYSYAIGATQVGIFDFHDDGSLSHRQTFFIDSNDYYSSRNYASRLIEGKLIFYMPYYLYVTATGPREDAYTLPQVRYWITENTTTDPKPILQPADIYKPVQSTNDPTLHTIVTCDLTGDVTCTAQAVLGPYSRNFYVSSNAVYLWVSGSYDYYYYEEESAPAIDESEGASNAYVYAMPLDGSGVGVARAQGTPLDQFSFKEGDDGTLNVMVQEVGFGDTMWGAEYSESRLALLRFPIDQFGDEPIALDNSYYRMLLQPEESYYTLQNRFVGDYFLYGSGSSWYDTASEQRVFVVEYKTPETEVLTVDLGSSVDRIEVLDQTNTVIVGSAGSDLVFNWLRLNDRPVSIVDTYTLANASQGETRSHGFFYSAEEGILGLPVRSGWDEGYYQLYEESSKVIYLAVEDNQLVDLGSLASTPQDRLFDDLCEFSCLDWYGNSRPIFYRDRIFALLGYELVEGERSDSSIFEVRRANFFGDITSEGE